MQHHYDNTTAECFVLKFYERLMIKIAPSILAADFAKLGEEIAGVETADYLHLDIMDGVFVPNISIGLPVLESVRKTTDMTFDVHLMITSPARYVSRFAGAGGDIIVFHVEAETEENTRAAINEIHGCGRKAGLAVKPGTSADELLPYIDMIDIALVMTVEPGFGGQEFMPGMLAKIERLKQIIDSRSLNCEIEVDGGINVKTAKMCVQAGANVLVAGSDIFRSADKAAQIETLRRGRIN